MKLILVALISALGTFGNMSFADEADVILYDCTRELDVARVEGHIYLRFYDGSMEALVQTVNANVLGTLDGSRELILNANGTATLLNYLDGSEIQCSAH